MLPPSIAICGTVLLGNLVLLTLLRVVFFLKFRPADQALASRDVLRAMRIGFRFDARLGALISLPLWLLAWIPAALDPSGGLAHGVWLGFLLMAEFLVLVSYLVDFATYSYLSTRLNAALTTFLSDLGISARMIWQSYPVVTLGLAIAAAVAGLGLGVRQLLAIERLGGTSGWPAIAIHAAFVMLLVSSIYGSLGWYPLRWSDAFFSRNRFLCQVALVQGDERTPCLPAIS